MERYRPKLLVVFTYFDYMAGHLITSIPVEKEDSILHLTYFIVQISIVRGIDQQTRYRQDKVIQRAKMKKGELLRCP